MMPLKHPSLAKAYTCLQCSLCSHPPAGAVSTSTSTSNWRSNTGPAKRRRVGPPLSQSRSYATVRPSWRPFDFRDNLNWPCHRIDKNGKVDASGSKPGWSGGLLPTPTPYEIFDMRPSAVYSKHQFYELVKMYHPDRHSHHVRSNPNHPIATLSRLECLERYRLVVRAHEILSDPVRRRAYDMSGAGWEDQHGIGPSARSSPHAHTPGSSRFDPDSCFGNATWEDWERWYARTANPPHADGPQAYDGTFVNPNMFASLVIVLAVISGIFQATHVSQYSGSIEERAIAFTAQTQQFLTERKADNSRYSGTRTHTPAHSPRQTDPESSRTSIVEERIKHFLERRDPYRSGLKETEGESYRRAFGGGSGSTSTSTSTSSTGKKAVKAKVEIAPD